MGRPGFSSRGDRCGQGEEFRERGCQGEEFRERGCQGGGFRGRGGRGGGFRGRDDNRGFSGRDDDRGFRGRCEDRGFRGRDEDRGFRGRDEGRGFRGRDEGRGFRGRDDNKGFRGRGDDRGFRGRGDDRGFRGRGDDRGFRGRDDDRGFRGRGDDRGFRGGRCGFGGGFRNDRPRSQSGDKASLGRGGRGGSRGRGRGPKGGRNAIIEPHRHEGVFISRGKNDALLTVNLVPGDKVYNENLVVVGEGTDKIEYRTWNPFRSKLAAAIMGGIGDIHMRRGSHVLYLGASSGTTVSHVSDIVGPEGMVYAVEFSVRSGRDLISVAQKRRNIVPIIEDARHVTKYRMLIGRVDVIFSDVAQPDQARILALNADHYLKPQGHFIISIKANCIDSTASAEAVVATEIEKLRKGNLKPLEKLTLEPYERDHTVVVGQYRSTPQAEKMKE